MPGMYGADLALASRELRPVLPILLATGYADLPSGVEIILLRFGKPYTQKQMQLEISKLLV